MPGTVRDSHSKPLSAWHEQYRKEIATLMRRAEVAVQLSRDNRRTAIRIRAYVAILNE